jgi:hypothetical protein
MKERKREIEKRERVREREKSLESVHPFTSKIRKSVRLPPHLTVVKALPSGSNPAGSTEGILDRSLFFYISNKNFIFFAFLSLSL